MKTSTLLKSGPLLTALLIPGLSRAQNLLTNPGFEAGNTGFTSAYLYVPPASSSPGAGSYTVGPDNQAFGGGTGARFNDHTTGTATGNYQIVDGSTSSTGTFWEQTVTGLTPNRSYSFSFWLLNAASTSKAQIQVSANGVDVGPGFTNASDGGSWQLNTVTVNPGNDTQLVLRLRDLNLDVSGNDFGVDDVALVSTTADVTTTLTGPGTLGAGVSSGTYTVVFSNNGPQAATQVTQVVALPTGATLSAAQRAALPGTAVYNSGPNTIDFGAVAVLNSGSASTYTFSFTAPAAQGANSLTSTVGTSTPQGGNTAPDQATVSVRVTAANFFVTNDDSNEVPGNTAATGGAAKTGNVLLNDANPTNLADGAFGVQLVAGPAHGTITLNPNGSYAYTPALDYLGPDGFTYQVNVPNTTPPNSNVSMVALNVYDASLVCSSGTGTNLLKNPSFAADTTGFKSTYGYAAATANFPLNQCLVPEGLYRVGTNAADYHPTFIGTGRTGPGDSFMIVNGSQNLSVVYQQTVAVQPNRYYTFSAYASSVNSMSPAQLGFVINGKSTSTITTLPAGVNVYVKISDLWYSGSNTQAVIEIRDVNKDKDGNDFGLDDLYVGTCTVSLAANDVMSAPMSNLATIRGVAPMSATVASGPAVGSFTIQTLPNPDSGVLYLHGLPVIPGQVIMLGEADQLAFDPVAGYLGNAVFTYTATDTSGSGSNNTATFTIPVGDTPLPVELTTFEVRAGRNLDAQLTWRTAQEHNNDHFEVERSFDGQAFARAGTVAGHGTTSSASNYAYTDAGVGAGHAGTVYYRLRQVDHDGTAVRSPVRTVAFSSPKDLVLYPSPTAGPATLDLSALAASSYQVTLVDATGRQVLSTSLPGGQRHPLLLTDLARGTYLLVVRGAGVKLSQRFVLE